MEKQLSIKKPKRIRQNLSKGSKRKLRPITTNEDKKFFHSLYDITTKPRSQFELNCYNSCSKEELRVAITNLYNTCKNIPSFVDICSWDKDDTIFEVAEFLNDFLYRISYATDFTLNEDYTEVILNNNYGFHEQFHAVFIEWITRLVDEEVKELCLDATSILIDNCNMPSDLMSMYSRYMMRDEMRMEHQMTIDDKNSDPEEVSDCKLNIEILDYIDDKYSDVEQQMLDIYKRIVDIDSLKSKYNLLLHKYIKERKCIIPFMYVKQIIKIQETGIDFDKLICDDTDGLWIGQNCCVYWTEHDEYWEEVAKEVDDYGNNVGCQDYVYTTTITKDSYVSEQKFDVVDKIRKLQNITRNKIYDSSIEFTQQ